MFVKARWPFARSVLVVVVSLDDDFTTVETGLVHRDSRLFGTLSSLEFNDAEAARGAALVKTHRRVEHFAKLSEGTAQLVSIDRVGQVADMD